MKKEGLVLNFKEVQYSPRIFTFSAPYRKRQTSHNAAKYNIWSIHWFLEFHEWPKHKKGFLEMVKEWNHSKRKKITLKYIFENVNHLRHYSKLFFRKQRQTFWKISKRTKQCLCQLSLVQDYVGFFIFITVSWGWDNETIFYRGV